MTATRRYAVIGQPVSHSLSPHIHAMFAAELGLPVEYGLLEPGTKGFSATVRDFFAAGASGLNVTLPFKEEAMAFADFASNGAKLAGAANTLKPNPDGTVSACNTDGAGLLVDIKRRHGQELLGKKILVIGAGGATAGIINPFVQERPAKLCIANRTLARAQRLVGRWAKECQESGVQLHAAGLDTMQDHAPFDIVIHATAAGHVDELPVLPPELFGGTGLAYDLSYGRMAAGFLALAQRCGAHQVKDGIGMLVEQAAFSFAYWEQKMPATDPVYAALCEEAGYKS